jgi:hypothetical protein
MEGRAFFSRKSGEVFSDSDIQKEKIVRLIVLGSCFLVRLLQFTLGN